LPSLALCIQRYESDRLILQLGECSETHYL
jgi:hypothetical protein